jgi:DnaK suppressor protein
MSNRADTALTREFIEQQRNRLEALRDELLGAERMLVDDVKTFHEVQGDEAQEFEDLAQDQAREEIRQAQHDVDKHRVENIERALVKIEQGTYGVSDRSGAPIPKSRLEAVPEAVLTVDEAAGQERPGRT